MILNNFTQKQFQMLRLIIILVNDLLILNLSLYFSYFLRIEYFLTFDQIKFASLIASIIYLLLFFIFKINKQYFRYFNTNSGQLYFKIYLLFGIVFGIYVILQESVYIPRSLILIFPSLYFFILIVNRIIIAKYFAYQLTQKKRKAVVFGFNSSNINALSSFVEILCFIDNKPRNRKRIVNGIKILSSREFDRDYNNYNFNLILIESENIFNLSKFKIRNHIINNQILVQKISSKKNELITSSYFDFNYFFNRNNKITKLGNTYKNKIILITGAGGSIGSNIVFQLLNSNFKKLILIDNSEYNLYKLSNLLSKEQNIYFNLTNFNDVEEMSYLLSKNNIDIVFHAAAYKHVPLIESNPFSSIKNNFLDTFEFMKLIIKFKIPNFCLISSDKAVRPTNIMGASKRLSELALLYLNNSTKHNTSLCSVRFGNVINSSGSVMPLFQHQIENNLQLTLTHKKITRYFMTIEEAANLVLNTQKISKGGEIFLLDMGKPIKLFDLAKLMIQFSGKTLKKNSHGDIEIKIIGLREGEKLFEELLIDERSIKSSINFIHQSLESNITNKEFKNLYTNIKKIYNSKNYLQLKKLLRNKYINYSFNDK